MRKCYFSVMAYSDMDYDFIEAACRRHRASGEKWKAEIEASFSQHKSGQSWYAPGETEDDYGRLCIVCETMTELRNCMQVMYEQGILPDSVHVTNAGCDSDATAKVQFQISEHNSWAQIDLPDSAPWLPGLIEARRAIGKMIEDNGGN
jgi:hypothetical protein